MLFETSLKNLGVMLLRALLESYHALAYWICVTNHDNWLIISKNKIWGVAPKYKPGISAITEGDILVFYIKGGYFVGIFKVVSEAFESQKRIFNPSTLGISSKEIFPYRLKIDPMWIKEVDVRKLIDRLSFITSKKKWGGHFFRPIVKIEKDDFKIIERAFRPA